MAQISSSSFVALEASEAGLGMVILGRAGLVSQLASFGCVANFGTGRASQLTVVGFEEVQPSSDFTLPANFATVGAG